MDIVKRNFFRLLRCGALGDMDELEPMSLFKWEKLVALVIFKKTEAVTTAAITEYSERQPDVMKANVVEMFRSNNVFNDNQGTISLPEANMSNFLLNRRLGKIREKELHSIDTSIETLNALNIILYNVYLLLNSGLSFNAIMCLGKYMRTKGDKIDFVKLESWLAKLQTQRMTQLEGSVLITYFGFEKDELPFTRRICHEAKNVMARALSKNAANDAEDMRFWEGKSGFVSGDAGALGHKIWTVMRFMSFAPVEASSNFIRNLANSLAKIEE